MPDLSVFTPGLGPVVCCDPATRRGAVLVEVSEQGFITCLCGNQLTKVASLEMFDVETFYQTYGTPDQRFDVPATVVRMLTEAASVEPSAQSWADHILTAFEPSIQGEDTMAITKNTPAKPAALKTAPKADPKVAPKADVKASTKSAKAEKPAAAEASEASEGRGAPRKYAEGTKIQILNKENPHREGTARAEAFATVLTSKTVDAYYEAGHKTKYLADWETSGHIKIG